MKCKVTNIGGRVLGLKMVILTAVIILCIILSFGRVASAEEENVTSLQASQASLVTMHRLYNPNSGEHFYTSNMYEKRKVISAGWIYEGIGWTAPKSSNTPVYRMYNPNAGDHHYTTAVSERDMLKRVGWTYEGIGWYSDDSRSVALFRQYNPNAKAGSHNFTSATSEKDKLVNKYGWKDEGIGWYGAVNPYFDGPICSEDHAWNVVAQSVQYVKVKKPFTQTVTRSMYNNECGKGDWFLYLTPDEQDEPDLYMRYKQTIAYHWPSGKEITENEAKAWKIQSLKDRWGDDYAYITTWDQVVDLKEGDEWIAEAYQKQPLKNTYTQRQLLDAQQVHSAKTEMALYEHQYKPWDDYKDEIAAAHSSGKLTDEEYRDVSWSYDASNAKDVKAKAAQEKIGIKVPVMGTDYHPYNWGFWRSKTHTYKIYRDSYAATCRACGGVKLS